MSERLVPVPRRARAWQPNPALLLVNTARAFAAAHWDEVRQELPQEDVLEDDESDSAHDALLDDALEDATRPHSFTHDGLSSAHDDFRPWQIRPFTQPLSELSRQALQRFNAELAAENPVATPDTLDEAQAPQISYRPNPMLSRGAFVPDVYEYDDEPVDAGPTPDDAEDSAQDDWQQEAQSDDEAGGQTDQVDQAVQSDIDLDVTRHPEADAFMDAESQDAAPADEQLAAEANEDAGLIDPVSELAQEAGHADAATDTATHTVTEAIDVAIDVTMTGMPRRLKRLKRR